MTGNSQDYYPNRRRWKSKDFFSSNFGITKHHFPQHLMFSQTTKTYANSREQTYIPPLKRRDNKVRCIGCFIHSLPHFNVLLSSHSVMSDSATPWAAACQAFQLFTISWSLLKLMSIESVMPSNHLILCHPLLLLPSIFPTIRVFSNELALPIRWPKYWSFSFNFTIF